MIRLQDLVRFESEVRDGADSRPCDHIEMSLLVRTRQPGQTAGSGLLKRSSRGKLPRGLRGTSWKLLDGKSLYSCNGD